MRPSPGRSSAMRFVVVVLAGAGLMLGCEGGGSRPDAGRTDVLADGGPDGTGDEGPGDVRDVPPDLQADGTPELPPADATDVADTFAMPDAAFVHAVREHADKVVDSPVLVDDPVQYRTTDKLPDLDVRAIAAVGDTVWAATATGVVRFDASKDLFEPIAMPPPGPAKAAAPAPVPLPPLDLAVSADGQLIAVAQSDVIH